VIKLSIKKFFQCKNEMKLGFGRRIQNAKELDVWNGSRAKELRRQIMIGLSIKKFSQCRNEVKIGFGGKTQNARELKVWRRSRVGGLRRQIMIELSIKKHLRIRNDRKCLVIIDNFLDQRKVEILKKVNDYYKFFRYLIENKHKKWLEATKRFMWYLQIGNL
jgi:hypothetical protein